MKSRIQTLFNHSGKQEVMIMLHRYITTALMCLTLIITLCSGLHAADSSEVDMKTVSQPTGIWAVQINVTDLDSALNFYTGILEFEILTREAYPIVVPLKNHDGNTSHILLFACDSLTKWDYLNQSKINLNLFIENLADWRERFSKAGVRILDDTNLVAGVGGYFRILDPWGNQIDIMELGYEHKPVSKPTVYNVGAQISDMNASRKFYEQLLGFEVFSNKYYPPVIPYKRDGMQLVLHEGAQTPSLAQYPNSSQMLLTVITPDLDAHLLRLEKAGFKRLRDKHSKAPVGIYNAVRDPDGNVIELLEWKDNLFDQARRGE